jgi:hypothetical protein
MLLDKQNVRFSNLRFVSVPDQNGNQSAPAALWHKSEVK